MDKVICDICGTSYPETADVCPICGYPRQDNKTAPALEGAAAEAAREKVKGGRFSKKNVKKRSKQENMSAKQQVYLDPEEDEEDQRNPNKPLLITIALLLIAIALVSCYIGVRFFRGRNPQNSGTNETSTAATTTAPAQTTTGPVEIVCRGVKLDVAEVELDAQNTQRKIEAITEPADTTQEILFASADESVATVSADGVITAVGTGETTITVTCGEVQVVCTVVCVMEEPTSEPAETTEPEETVTDELVLSHTDATLFSKGEAFTISVTKEGNRINRSDVKWSTSDETIATVENGVVTAVAPGVATITASYDGKEAQCIVRCSFKAEETEPETTEPETEPDDGWSISDTDVTIVVGESFLLRIRNGAGETADVTWSASSEGIVSVSGNTVTGVAAGTVTLSATVDGVTYSCIVRVKEPANNDQ